MKEEFDKLHENYSQSLIVLSEFDSSMEYRLSMILSSWQKNSSATLDDCTRIKPLCTPILLANKHIDSVIFYRIIIGY